MPFPDGKYSTSDERPWSEQDHDGSFGVPTLVRGSGQLIEVSQQIGALQVAGCSILQQEFWVPTLPTGLLSSVRQ